MLILYINAKFYLYLDCSEGMNPGPGKYKM